MPSDPQSPTRPPTSAVPAPTISTPDFPANRRAVIVLVATAVIVLSQLYAAIPLRSPVAASLGGEAAFALSTSFSLTYAIGFLMWGPISDRFGRRRIIALALGALALATGLCAIAPSVSAMAALRALQGLAASGFAPVALAYLSEAVAPSRRAGAIGAMSAAFLVAGILGQVLASVIALRADWRWFFILCSLLLAAAFAWVLVRLPDAPHRAAATSLLTQFKTLGRLFVRPTIVLLSLAHLTLLLSFVALYTGIARHAESLAVPDSAVLLIRLAALPVMLLSLAVGPVIRRAGAIGAARLGFSLAAIGMLGEALLSPTLPGLVAASIVHVAGVALAVPAMIGLYGHYSAPHRGQPPPGGPGPQAGPPGRRAAPPD